LHTKQTEMSQKQSEETKIFKISYYIISEVLKNEMTKIIEVRCTLMYNLVRSTIWFGTEDIHMTVLNCFDLLSLTTPIFEEGQPEQTRNTAYFHVIGNGGNRFCVSNAHCIEMQMNFNRTALYIST
jgi:hypothetical protein